jgi:hypothetical protein
MPGGTQAVERPPKLDKIGGEDAFALVYNDREQYRTTHDVQRALKIGKYARQAIVAYLNAERPGLLIDRRMLYDAERAGEPSTWTTKRFVVTTVQNNVNVVHGAWKTLEHYARVNSAEIHVLGVSYWPAGAEGWKADRGGEVSWPDVALPYLHTDRLRPGENHNYPLCDGVNLRTVKISATAINPLAGQSSGAEAQCAIFANCQFGIEYLPRSISDPPIWLATPGSITPPDFMRTSGVGDKAAHHHSLGFMVVESYGPHVWYRWCKFDHNNGVIDLDRYYRGNKIAPAKRARAISTPDEHHVWQDESVAKAIWGPGGVNDLLSPKRLYRHDVHDQMAENHHDNTWTETAKWARGVDCVETEVAASLGMVIATTREGQESIMVGSNHHEHLEKWLQKPERDVRPKNRALHCELRGALHRAAEEGRELTALQAYAELRGLDLSRVRFPGRHEPLLEAGIDCGQHGHEGPKGGRGPSLQGWARLARKVIVGHGHAPGWRLGAMRNGVMGSSEAAGYTGSLTDWDSVLSVINADGSRTLLPLRMGRAKAP